MKGEAGMKNRSLVLLTVLVFLVSVVSSAVAATSILDEVKKRGVVRIGSGTTVPPVNYIDKDGNWTGFDIEIGDEPIVLCRQVDFVAKLHISSALDDDVAMRLEQANDLL